MQTQSKPITVLLVVIAALLAANLFVNLLPQVVGANPPRTALSGDDDEAVLVGISVWESKVIRLWSDGVVEERQAHINGPVPNLHWNGEYPEWVEVVPFAP